MLDGTVSCLPVPAKLVKIKKDIRATHIPMNIFRLTRFFAALLCVCLWWVPPATAEAPILPSAAAPSLLSPAISPPLNTLIKTTSNDGSSFVAAAVRKVGAAVVRIDTEKTVNQKIDPALEDFMFGMPMQPQQQKMRGQGSGFIIDSQGILLTNAHVVNEADRVTVTLKDGRTFDGKVQGVDPVTDLAVVKISGAKNLPVAPLGKSDEVQVGDWAIAVGNPLGLDNTVTLGIVSTLKRSSATIGMGDKRIEFIQTDAAINPGNSGGPLLNGQGEVIGINTAIRADATGIGFAIPIDKAKSISIQLAKGEKVSHPYLGIQMATVTPQLAIENNTDPNSAFRVPEVNGVLVVRVLPNTAAASAGMRRGDVILDVDGTPVASSEELQNLVENSQISKRLNLTIERRGKSKQIVIKPGELNS
jgi:S1-C subfamily serine protease